MATRIAPAWTRGLNDVGAKRCVVAYFCNGNSKYSSREPHFPFGDAYRCRGRGGGVDCGRLLRNAGPFAAPCPDLPRARHSGCRRLALANERMEKLGNHCGRNCGRPLHGGCFAGSSKHSRRGHYSFHAGALSWRIGRPCDFSRGAGGFMFCRMPFYLDCISAFLDGGRTSWASVGLVGRKNNRAAVIGRRNFRRRRFFTVDVSVIRLLALKHGLAANSPRPLRRFCNPCGTVYLSCSSCLFGKVVCCFARCCLSRRRRLHADGCVRMAKCRAVDDPLELAGDCRAFANACRRVDGPVGKLADRIA